MLYSVAVEVRVVEVVEKIHRWIVIVVVME